MTQPLDPIKLSARDAELLALHAEELLTPYQAKELSTRLHAEPALLSAIARFAEIEEHLRALFDEQEAADRGDWYEMMAELAKAEAKAEVQPVQLVKNESNPLKHSGDQPTMKQVGQALWYIGRQSKVWIPIAAVLAITLTLAIVFSGGGHNPPAETARQPSTQNNPNASATAEAVATLTDSYEAQWSIPGGSLAPTIGDALRSGQRLTLTVGFAEITTARGAIAIVEAPATIEFSHNNNAIRLHTGKLVGICETESSKGFLVRTPHMDITDLGTRFGVDVTAYRATQVHVQKGEVHVLHTAASSHRAPMALNAGQSARATAGSTAIVRIDYDTDRFASLSPQTITLPGTGLGLAVGDPDPNWQVVAVDGQPLDTPQALAISGDENYTRHVANDPSSSQFISWYPEDEIPTGKLASYTLRTTISLPATVNLDGARLTLRCMVDNELLAVVVNGQRTAISGKHFEVYDQWTEHTLTNPLQSGTNIIEFEVRNHPFEGATTNPVGLRLQWELRTEPWLPSVGDAVSHLTPCTKGCLNNRASRLIT